MTTASSSLAVRETILGVLKGKDVDGTGNIHSSDFRTAVSDLGFPMGSQIVEDILVHCRIDPRSGNIDFSDLERELSRERRVVNSRPKEDKTKTVSTSRGIQQCPWRADVLHNEKLQADLQSKRVGENRHNVHEIYKNFINHIYSADETVGHLQALGIEPTRAFMTLLQQSQACAEIKFADFTRSLVIYDPRNSNGSDTDRPAGALHPGLRPQVKCVPEVDAELIPQFKRKNPIAFNAATLTNIPVDKSLRTGKKMTLEIDPQTGQVSSKFKSSHVVRQTVFSQDSTQQLLSHAQLDQQTGVLGEQISLTYNSEQKLLREQVLAALRKLDSGELSLPEFQDKVFDMGFELPEIIIKELRRSTHAGLLNWKKCVEILDAEVFKVHALFDRVLPETVQQAKDNLIHALSEGGANSLSNLAAAFRKMDTNGDNCLSLNELKAGFHSYGIQVSDEDVRILFNAFDTSGDGMLSVNEFLVGIRGEISPSRLNIIRSAYQRLNRTGRDCVDLEVITSSFNAAYHPDVISGQKTERKAVSEMCVALTASSSDGTVSRESFEEFFSNLSVAFDADELFNQFIANSFHINLRKAPPVLQANLKSSGNKDTLVMIPKAKQVHGDCITWAQDKSELEIEGDRFDQTSRGIIQHHNKLSSVVVSPSKTPASPEQQVNEFRAVGGVAIRQTGITNHSDRSLLAWNVAKKKSPTKKKVAQEEQENFTLPADTHYAKSPTKEDDRGFLFSGYHWSPARYAQYNKPSPFAVSEDGDPFIEAAVASRPNSANKRNSSDGATQSSPKPLSALVSKLNGGGPGNSPEIKPKQLKTLMDIAKAKH